MNRRTTELSILLLAVLCALPHPALRACGVERWSVKTGSDADSGLVNLSSATAQTILTMRGWTAPSPIPANNRVSPYETTEWVMNVTLVEYKAETDEDYHLVIKDASGNTMIAEIPAPGCVAVGSPFASGIQNSRSQFDAVYSATSSFTTVNVPVRIKGVGMFDFLHGQTGVAPNGIEIHPVLDIVFNPSSTTYSISGSAGTTGATVTAGGASATSDSSNNYSIAGLANGTYTVTPSKTGCTFSPASQSVTVSGANVTGKNFTASCSTPTYSISGSAGTTGATVTAGSASATSDSSNNYTVSGLANGTYTVTPSKSGCTFSPASQSVTVSGANVTGKNFTATCSTGDTQLTSGVTLTGQSVAASAWKYYYITVSAGATNLTMATTASTGDIDIYTQSGAKPTSSSYVCRPYTSTGNESCSATNPAAGTWWLGVYGYAAGSYSVTATITTSTPTYSIAGSAGTASATVTAGSASATSDASNNYTIAGLANGTYTVTPSKSGCTFSPVSQSVTISGANVTGKNFTATCGTGTTTLFTDGFEAAGWSYAQVSGTAGYWTLAASGTQPSASPHAGSKLADFNSYTSASGSQTRMYMTTGVAVAGSYTTVTLKFWMYHDTGYSTSADKVQVQVSTNGTTWTNVGTAVNRYTGSTGWAQATVDLSAYKGQTVQVGFVGVSAYGNDIYLDDVTVTAQ